uniref:Ribonuclease H domain-containing protein n=1 Tax=Tanacetum cinerariifolium TaxID=118510 RepID=A0A6L2LN78_TANCI|nr:ribonuclease H domain-containing protein [Tanacetum cinerariifolium]
MDVHENERKKRNSFYVKKPFESLQSSSNEVFKVYFKYLVSDETLARIGVSICDKRDRCVFEMKKPIILDDDSEDGVNGEAVGLNALIEALDIAIGMRIKVVHVLYDRNQLRQYEKEAFIPLAERVTCPFSNCSYLMSEVEVLEYTVDLFVAAKGTGIRKCVKCHSLFCKTCKVPWHNNVTCSEYMTYNQAENDVKLKSLATKKRWLETSFGGIGVAICDLDDYCMFEVRKQVTISRDMEGDVVELLALIEGLNSAVELGIKLETSFGGIGVAICDLDDYCMFEVRKQVTISRDMEGDVVELLALIEGLNSAVELGIKRVQILCDNHLVYQYRNVSRVNSICKLEPEHQKSATLKNLQEILNQQHTLEPPQQHE